MKPVINHSAIEAIAGIARAQQQKKRATESLQPAFYRVLT